MTEPVKAVEMDATVEPEGSTVTLVTEAGEAVLLIPPPAQWKARATHALRLGDFTEWAEVVLSDEDYQAWSELDPTVADVETFFDAWKQVSGDDPKPSGHSTRSSKVTRKR